MRQYLNLFKDILANGYNHGDRTGAGRRTVQGRMIHFDVSSGKIPMVTTRRLYPDSVVGEILWIIKGSDNVKDLQKLGVNFWNRWAVSEKDIEEFVNKQVELYGDNMEINAADLIGYISDDALSSIGPIYGPNWRNAPIKYEQSMDNRESYTTFDMLPSDKIVMYTQEYIESEILDPIVFDANSAAFKQYCIRRYCESVDQLNELVINLKKQPYSSRLVVNTWIPEFIPREDLSPQQNVLNGRGALAPCHVMFQCFVKPSDTPDGKLKLSLMMTQRSVDTCIGMPVNIAQYSILLHMLAHVSDMEADQFIWVGGDVHIYLSNHEQVIKQQLENEPYPAPTIWLNPEVKDLFAFTKNDIKILDYQCHDVLNFDIHV